MKIGIFLDSVCDPKRGDSHADVLDETLQLVEATEEAGLDGVWFGEHHFLPDNVDPPPLLMAAAAIQHTSRITIGTSILLLPMHNPIHVAEQTCLLSQLSRGRFELGVGLGYRASEFGAFGVNRSTRARRMDESLQVLQKYLAGEPFSFQGELMQHHDVQPTLQPYGQLRLWVGARGPVATTRAGRFGMSLMAGSGTIAYQEWVDALIAAGHDPQEQGVALLRTAHIADNADEAWNVAGEAILYEQQATRAWYSTAGDLAKDVKPVGETIEDRRRVTRFVGTVDDVLRDSRATANRFTGPAPLEWLIFNPRPGQLDVKVALSQISRLGAEVAPALRAG